MIELRFRFLLIRISKRCCLVNHCATTRSITNDVRFRTLYTCLVSRGTLLVRDLFENWISWRIPFNIQLLSMDNFITVNYFFNNFSGFFFIHLPYFIKSGIIRFFKPFELFLKFFKLLCKLFKWISGSNVVSLELWKLSVIKLFNFTYNGCITLLTGL